MRRFLVQAHRVLKIAPVAVVLTHAARCDATPPASTAAQQPVAFSAAVYQTQLSTLKSIPQGPQRTEALHSLAQLVEQFADGSGEAVPRLTDEDTVLALSAEARSAADPAARRAAIRLLSAYACMPRWEVLASDAVVGTLVAVVTDYAAALSSSSSSSSSDAAAAVNYATRALSNLAVEPGNHLERYGVKLLQSLAAVAATSGAAGAPERRAYAVIALAGCSSKQGFTEEQYCAGRTLQALLSAVALSRSEPGAREPRFAITAIRELLAKAARSHASTSTSTSTTTSATAASSRLSPLEQAAVAAGAVRAIQVEVDEATHNIWTRRAACKALAALLRQPALLAASGVTVESAMVSLQSASKSDWMCAKAARDAETWLRSSGSSGSSGGGGGGGANSNSNSSGKSKKKWYED